MIPVIFLLNKRKISALDFSLRKMEAFSEINAMTS